MKNVEDLYPLSPMQRTMLLHAVAATHSDKLLNQFCFTVRGRVDPGAFERAWQRVVDRHPSLRTAFVWDDLPDPLQVVRKQVSLPFELEDWRGLDVSMREDALREYRARDVARGFEFGRAPLMRVALLQCSDEFAYMIWTSHHLVLDRWCSSVVLEDFADFYESEREERARRTDPIRRPDANARFRDYISWIQSQDAARARAFWCEEVRGIRAASRAVLGPRVRTKESSATLRLGHESWEAVRACARKVHVTPSAVIQGAWALLLHQRNPRADSVFGATVSGRPAELGGIESMVGSFINNVPVRVRLPAAQSVRDWLRSLHRKQQERSSFDHVSPAEIHELSGLAANEALFDSLLVWLAPAGSRDPSGLELRGFDEAVQTTWPVTLVVTEQARDLELRLQVAFEHVGQIDPTATLDELRAIIVGLTEAVDERLGDLDWYRLSVGGPEPVDPALTGPTGHTRTAGSAARQALVSKGREGEELAMVRDMLLVQCRELLETDVLRAEDNFFDAGGNSLLATLLHARIENITGRVVPVLGLFETENIEAMARFLAQRQFPLRTEMVRAVKPEGSKTPLLCISSPEVNSIGYVLLARHLDPDQPVYLVQSPPSAEDKVLRMAITQIPDLAARYVDAIRELQPHGPYRLMGMCDGALIAFEIAKLLEDSGDEVEFCGVLNTFSLGTLSRFNHLYRAQNRIRYYAGRIDAFRQLGWGRHRRAVGNVVRRRLDALSSAFKDRPAAAQAQAERVADRATDHEPGVRCVDVPTSETVQREWQELDWPERYRDVAKYSGRVTVFRIHKQPYFRIRDRELGWGQHAETVDVVYLDTREQADADRRHWMEPHLELLREPRVKDTAAAVSGCLRRIPDLAT